MWLARVSDFINKIVTYIIFPILLFMFVIVVVAVILRLINISFISSYDISRLSFVWLIYLSITVVYKRNRHIRFSFLYNKLKGMQKVIVDLILHSLIFVFFAVILYTYLNFHPLIKVQNLPGSGLSALWLYSPFFFAPAIMLIHSMSFIYDNIRLLKIRDLESQ